MTTRILILGGYGNFGAHIARKLSVEEGLEIIVAGRSLEKGQALVKELHGNASPPRAVKLDIAQNLPHVLENMKPDIVIHTCGPFQGQGYDVARDCIEGGCHYIDLADGREFVSGISALDAAAKEKGVAVISGASSVPCLTAAVLDHHLPQFGKLKEIDYGISTAQRANTGLATTAAVLGYVGKPFKTLIGGKMREVHGWQGLARRKYPGLGARLLGYCDVPDLDIFPTRYESLETIRFRAGAELSVIHLGLWGLSWLVRAGLVKSLAPMAGRLMKMSHWLDALGSDKSGFHMYMTGTDALGKPKTVRFYLIAKSGDGPFIPSTPAILCAKMLARRELQRRGAFPCVGVISLVQYLEGLSGLDITPVFDA
ncbi:MAG: potassium transporter [Alphaproteobacteria bacterium]|nr:potassium transporter [Alphaproteobacteria bacterium]